MGAANVFGVYPTNGFGKRAKSGPKGGDNRLGRKLLMSPGLRKFLRLLGKRDVTPWWTRLRRIFLGGAAPTFGGARPVGRQPIVNAQVLTHLNTSQDGLWIKPCHDVFLRIFDGRSKH